MYGWQGLTDTCSESCILQACPVPHQKQGQGAHHSTSWYTLLPQPYPRPTLLAALSWSSRSPGWRGMTTIKSPVLFVPYSEMIWDFLMLCNFHHHLYGLGCYFPSMMHKVCYMFIIMSIYLKIPIASISEQVSSVKIRWLKLRRYWILAWQQREWRSGTNTTAEQLLYISIIRGW